MILLDWPPRTLSPNARAHWATKAHAVKSYREHAWVMALAAGVSIPASGTIRITITFRPPNKRRRDIDNMLASIKAGLDGIATALACDDSRFEITMRRGDVLRPHGGVMVEIGGDL